MPDSRLQRGLALLQPPIFPSNAEKSRRARYTNVLSLSVFALIVVRFLLSWVVGPTPTQGMFDLILIGLGAAALAGWLLVRRGHVRSSAIVLVSALWVGANGLALFGGGIGDLSYLFNFSIAILAGLLLGWRAGVLSSLASVMAGLGLARIEEIGLVGTHAFSPIAYAVATSMVLVVNILALYLLISGLESEIRKSWLMAQELEASNAELRDARAALESRTLELSQGRQELETVGQHLRQRAAQFEGLAAVTQIISSVRDLRDLLPRIAAAVSENFGFYHVGLFLLDETGEYAILSATNSDGGRRMLERRHRLRVGKQGIVGDVAATGEPRIAMDVGLDATYFDNSELPDTHSEMALPLKSSSGVIGVLDVQSDQVGAFTNEDLHMLTLLANQVSLAIENARLFDDTRAALAEAEAISRQVTRAAWGRLPTEAHLHGFRYDVSGATPLDGSVILTQGFTAGGQSDAEDLTKVVVPIQLRGETIGTLLVQTPSGETPTKDQVDLIKAVAERVALAAENARLFEETTRRAERERRVSEITGKIRSVQDPKAMIQTAVEELRNALGASRVEILPQSTGGPERREQ